MSDAAIQRALERCAAEPVHRPGVIQPHGALLAVDEILAIRFASANTSAFMRVNPHQLLGRSVQDVFARKTRHDMANAVMQVRALECPVDVGPLQFGDQTLSVTASPSGNFTVFELEVARHLPDTSGKTLKELERMLREARAVKSQNDLFDKSAELLRSLTGYDRVKIYVFDDEGHGTVEAEAAAPDVDSFLGLRFPAWDIPEQARDLMRKLPFRYFYDVNANPVPIFSADDDADELDLTYAHLRGSSPVHMEYLRNMGVEASFTLHIVLGGKLWGLIAFHHTAPRYPSPRIRKMCSHFVDFFTLQLQNFRAQSDVARLGQPGELRRSLEKYEDGGHLNGVFAPDFLQQMADAMNADGAAFVRQDTAITVGKTPKPSDLNTLISRLCFENTVERTADVARDNTDIAPLMQPRFGGFLAIRWSEDCTIIFFRIARDRLIKWAGAPDKTIAEGGGGPRLSPRLSFRAYQQSVSGTSEPWTKEQVHLAEDVRAMLVASDRADHIRRTDQQKTQLTDELNARVRNILTLVRSLSQKAISENTSVEGYAKALEAKIATFARAHELGAGRPASFVSLRQIFEQEARGYNHAETRVCYSGLDARIRADLAPVLAVTMHKLLAHAAQQGALSNVEGRVSCHVVETEAGIDIAWHETGGPKPVKLARQGARSQVIENAIVFQLSGTVKGMCLGECYALHISLPQSVLHDPAEGTSVDTSQAIGVQTKATTTAPQLPDLRCLLLENDYAVSLETTRILRSLGLRQINSALTSSDAMAQIEAFNPQVAVLDFNLSAEDTSEKVADRLSQLNIPFLFLTGYGHAMTLGARYRNCVVLKKPVCENDLREAIAQVSS